MGKRISASAYREKAAETSSTRRGENMLRKGPALEGRAVIQKRK